MHLVRNLKIIEKKNFILIRYQCVIIDYEKTNEVALIYRYFYILYYTLMEIS